MESSSKLMPANTWASPMLCSRLYSPRRAVSIIFWMLTA
jgi:hypothetical protein